MSALSEIESEGENCVILFRGSGEIRNDSQTETMIGRYARDINVIYLGVGIIKPLLNAIAIGIAFRIFGKVKVVNTGDYRSRIGNIIIKLAKADRVVILDDGVAILNLCFGDVNGSLTVGEGVNKINCGKNLEISTLLRVSGDNKVLVRHNPIKEWIKRHQREVKTVNQNLVYVIGSKVVEEGIMTYQAYSDICNKVLNRIPQDSIVFYIPHRGESESKLKVIEEQFKFTVKKIALPIELFLAEAEVLPALVIGMISAALITVSECYDEIIVCAVKINSVDIKAEYLEGILNTESYIFKSSAIETI